MDPTDKTWSILIQGQSRPSDYDKLEEYHRNDFCGHTKSAHENTKKSIKNNPDRQATWYKLVWPESTVLDNVILSGDPSEVSRQAVGIRFQSGTIDTCSMFVYWSIAKKNVGIQIDAVGSPRDAMSQAFD